MGQGPIRPDLTRAWGTISFGPGAESPLITFESWKFVPTMETIANPTHIPDLVYQNIRNTNHFIFHHSITAVCWAWPIGRIGPKWWRHHPSFWAITPGEMNQFRWGFRHLIGIDILRPYSKFKKNRRSRFWENQQSVGFWANLGLKRAQKGLPNASIDMGPSPFDKYWCPLSLCQV